MKSNREDNPSAPYVDPFDRAIGVLHGLPDVTFTKTSVSRVIPPFGVGGTQLYVVQTYRQKEQGDTIFLEHVSETGTVRLVIPPQVAAVIARQRESSRRNAARAHCDYIGAEGQLIFVCVDTHPVF